MAVKFLSGIDVDGSLNLAASDIPNLAASKVTSGTFATARIPNLAASKITSGTIAAARIPDLSATYQVAGSYQASGSYQAAGNYFTDGDTVINMANNDGFSYNDTTNVMSVKLDGTLRELYHTGNLTPLTIGTSATTAMAGNTSLFDGAYSSLSGLPTLFDGDYDTLTNKPSLFDGAYGSLTGTPTLFDGTYDALTGKPTLGTAAATASSAYATSAQGTRADDALPKAGGTMTGSLTIGNGTAATRLIIKRVDSTTSDDIQFFNGTTRVGEIGTQDTSWLRINQHTNKNIYTPRYMRADGGFFVDGTAKGINGSGNFIGGSITGASDANVSNWDTAYGWGNHANGDYVTAEALGEYGFLTSETDSQTLSISGTTLSLTNGGSVTLPTSTGPAGSDGSNGTDGADGDSVTGVSLVNYELIVEIEGTEVNLGNVRGAAGSNGTNGSNGSNGTDGAEGARGPEGPEGPEGPQGPAGSNGTNGSDGADGDANLDNLSNNGNNLSGTFTATGDLIAYSDARVKENVETIPNALEKVSALRGVNFNKIGEEKRSTGVIAQEVAEVFPEVVHETEEGMLAVAYGNITGLLIEAIKEQQKQIEELKARLDGSAK
jgi:hypothetical protein